MILMSSSRLKIMHFVFSSAFLKNTITPLLGSNCRLEMSADWVMIDLNHLTRPTTALEQPQIGFGGEQGSKPRHFNAIKKS